MSVEPSNERQGYETGYEALLKHFKEVQKQSPKGVSLKRNRQTVNLQFNMNGNRSPHGCNCSFSYDGIAEALSKARRVADKLKKVDCETEFWEWYDKEIKEESAIARDLLTFGEAIKLVEDDFWNGYRRGKKEKQERSRQHPSDKASWEETYGRFYCLLPHGKPFNLEDIKRATSQKERGTKTYKGCICAYKKIARLAKHQKTISWLDTLSVEQTKFRELQNLDLDAFLEWRDKVLGNDGDLPKRADPIVREQWMWVFSTQLVYGLRIGEVFAILNLTESYTTKDGESIPALSDPANSDNAIWLSNETRIGTTIKTGSRLCRPFIPPSYPDLLERLNIKACLEPSNRPKEGSGCIRLRNFYNMTARNYMVKWNAPFTQTHASRGLANLNGMQAGISQEVRAQSLGHTVEMNEKAYKKRQSTKLARDILFNSNKQAIDLVSALNAAKDIIQLYPDSKDGVIALLARIYQKDSVEITKLFE